MNHETVVQFAVQCLQELDAHAGEALSFKEISQRQGIPLLECTQVIRRLGHAGIVELAETGRVVLRRPVEELTALDILEAVWTHAAARPDFQLLMGNRVAIEATLAYVQRREASGTDFALNG